VRPDHHQARRLACLAREAAQSVQLDLHGAVVITEAATGAYSVTAPLAAWAGAEVVALARPSRYGTLEQAAASVAKVADILGVGAQVSVVDALGAEELRAADVVTNSGHLRPLSRALLKQLKPGAVVPLMFEAWEVEAGRHDVDLVALRDLGIEHAGTNERHPAIDVFSYLGPMAVFALHQAGFPVYRTRIAVWCDNPFRSYIVDGLERMGAYVHPAALLEELLESPDGAPFEVLLVAVTPTGRPVLSDDVERLVRRSPEVTVVQYWGDVDRESLHEHDVQCWPVTAPAAGHMAVLPSAIGFDPIVRLQAGGLKVAEILLKPAEHRSAADVAFLDVA